MKTTKLILLMALLCLSFQPATGKGLTGNWEYANEEIACMLVLHTDQLYNFNPHQPSQPCNGFMQVYMKSPGGGTSSLLATYQFMVTGAKNSKATLTYSGGRDWESDVAGTCEIELKDGKLIMTDTSDIMHLAIFDGLTLSLSANQGLDGYTKSQPTITEDSMMVKVVKALQSIPSLIWDKCSWYAAILIYIVLILLAAAIGYFGYEYIGGYVEDSTMPRRSLFSIIFLMLYGVICSVLIYGDQWYNVGRFTRYQGYGGGAGLLVVLCTYLAVLAVFFVIHGGFRAKNYKLGIISILLAIFAFVAGVMLHQVLGFIMFIGVIVVVICILPGAFNNLNNRQRSKNSKGSALNDLHHEERRNRERAGDALKEHLEDADNPFKESALDSAARDLEESRRKIREKENE